MPIVDSHGVPIYYEVFGDGPPVVLVHGFGSSFAQQWSAGWVDYLVAQQRQVIGLDCRGHGGSGKPHDPSAYAGDLMPDDVITVMDAAGATQADLLGYSMGGVIAQVLLCRKPERFRSVMVGGAGLPSAAPDPARRTALAAVLETDDISSVADAHLVRFRAALARSPENDLKALAAVQRADRARQSEAALARVSVPTLVVAGEQDDALEPARRLARTVPGAALVVLEGEDHFSAVRAAGFKSAVGEFLAQHAAARTSR